MKHVLIIWVFIFLVSASQAQYSRHIIHLSNKAGSGYTLKDPTAYLSAKALERRAKSLTEIDSTDLPVTKTYIDSIKAAGSVTILSYSKWLNQVLIQTTDAAALNKISNFPFVKKTSPVANKNNGNLIYTDKFRTYDQAQSQQPQIETKLQSDVYDYGSNASQVHIHHGEYLHNLGFTGKGITIAILDGGFLNYTVLKAFDSVRNHNQILGTWDFVANETSVDEDHPHGMFCFSIMAANETGKYIGTAPKASYYLFRTEDVASEFPVEEHNWVVAAEKADSAGADMISSSLGYSLFDDPVFNYSYADLNGDITMISRGADLAAKKGMIVCNSAGNSGNEAWKYIIAPADGDSVLAVGAVRIDSVPGSFSSYGPSADGRIKPDVASVGVNTWIINVDGTVARGSGTSFANPNLAGLIACLWQAFPEFSNMAILDAVKKSSHKYANPDDRVGYGIPDMKKAYDLLLKQRADRVLKTDWVKAYPNPVVTTANVIVKAQETGDLLTQLSDMSGKLIQSSRTPVQQGQVYFLKIDKINSVPSGVYHLRVFNGKSNTTIRLVK